MPKNSIAKVRLGQARNLFRQIVGGPAENAKPKKRATPRVAKRSTRAGGIELYQYSGSE